MSFFTRQKVPTIEAFRAELDAWRPHMLQTFMEPSIVEGRAYHPGDIVILRTTEAITRDHFEMLRKELHKLEDRTGLKFLLVSHSLEVVEPSEVEA